MRSDDGFEEFSDNGFSDEEDSKNHEEDETGDYFSDENQGYKETDTDSPFEIPFSNMRGLGKRKPKIVIQDQTINVPERDNDVNIGLPDRSPSASPHNESEKEEGVKEEVGAGLSDFMKNFLKRAQEDTHSPQNEATKELKTELIDIAPQKKVKTFQEDYEERIAKFANTGVAINGIMEDDEFGAEDPLELLGLASEKKKKKDKKKVKEPEKKSVLPQVTSYSVGLDKSSGLTSSVQAQTIAAQKEKEKRDEQHVRLIQIGSSSS